MDKELPKWIHTIPANPDRKEITINGNEYTLNIPNKTAILKKGFPSRLVIIPESVSFKDVDYHLTEIYNRAFNETNGIEEIRIFGKGLIIQDFAFKCCSDLQKVSLSGHIVRMGKSVFYRCEKLKEIIISGKIDSFDSNLFAYCTQLEQFVFPEGISQMSKGMFRGCSSLKTISIPDGFEQVPEAAFLECSSLETVNLPPSVKEIGKYAFLDCDSLKQINYSESTTLREGCFKRTPFDPLWRERHPFTDNQKKRYSDLDEIRHNLESGIVLSDSRSVYDTSGFLLYGDNLFNVIKDFTDGSSIHNRISETLKTGLEHRGQVYYYPYGDVFARVCMGSSSAHFIRMGENRAPLGKATKRRLLEEGISECYLDNPELWMSDFLHRNPDIPCILSEALKGLGFNVAPNVIQSLALERIHTDETLEDWSKLCWDTNHLGILTKGICSFYLNIEKFYSGYSGEIYFRKIGICYIGLINQLRYRIISDKLLG